MQDTSVQAMTEVALALSMAFFALLMLALLSMSANKSNPSPKAETIVNDYLQEVLASGQGGVKANQHFLFWYMGQFFDKEMKSLNRLTTEALLATYLADNTQQGDELVLVVSQQTPVSEISHLQTLFKARDFTLTVMTEEWEDAFEGR